MPPKKQFRAEDVLDPMAAAPSTATTTEPKKSVAEEVRQRLEAQKLQRGEKPLNRRQRLGGLVDPAIKAAVVAHVGAGSARQGLFGSRVPNPGDNASTNAGGLAALFKEAAPGAADDDAAAAVSEEDHGAAWASAKELRGQPLLDPLRAVPDIEPWDDAILCAPSYDLGIDDGRIDNLEHHVPLVYGHHVLPDDVVMPLVKTKDELRKERHLRRVEAAKERQENRRAGVLPKEEQKLGLRHLGSSAIMLNSVASPTEIETMIREQVQKRVLDHYENNEMRHRAAADDQKKHHYDVLQRKASERPVIAVYRVLGATDEHFLTKVKINAKDRLMRGMILWIQQQWAVIVLVGGIRPLRHVVAAIKGHFDAGKRDQTLGQHTAIDLIWCGPLSPSVHAVKYYVPKELKDVKPDGPTHTELVRLVKFKTAAAALAALREEELGFVWEAVVSAPVEGNLVRPDSMLLW